MSCLRGRLSHCWNQAHDGQLTWTVLVSLLVVALVLRLSAVLVIPIDYRLRDDALKYLHLAQQLLGPGVYGLGGDSPDARIPPGYPLFLASIFAVAGRNLMAVRLLQAILGTITVWLTFVIGKEAFSSRIGLLGAFMLTLYPVWVVWPALILTETLFTVFLLAFALNLVRAMKGCSSLHVVGGGVAFSLALLVREVLYGFPLAFPLALLWSRIRWRDALRCVVLFSCAALLVLLPWLARNHIVFGQIFYTDGSARARYRVTGTGYLPPHVPQRLNDSPGDNGAARRDELYGQTSEMIRLGRLYSEPLIYLRQLLNRLIEFWLHPNGLQALPDNLLVRGLYIAVHVCILALAGLGLVPELARRNVAAGNLALLLIYITGTALFFGAPNPRYNLPFLPIVFIFAARGALALIQRFVAREPLSTERAQP